MEAGPPMAMCWLELYEGTLRTPRMAMGTSPKDRRSKYMPLTTEGRLSFRNGSSSALMMLQGPTLPYGSVQTYGP